MLLDLFRTPRRRQVAALCWRAGAAGPEVMLVTTRRTKRWTPPKGWPMEGRTLAAAAAQEAWEEAGVKGPVSEYAIGDYSYIKTEHGDGVITPVRVEVFPLEVTQIADEFPEHRQRKRRWMSPRAASDMVHEPELKRLLANFAA